MDAKQYYDTIARVAELVDKQQDFDQAVEMLETIIRSDLPDIDRSIMCVNMAVVCDRMGHADHALQWYDHGIALEAPHLRCFVAIKKAEYLAHRGQTAEAIAILERLLTHTYHSTPEREQIKAGIGQLTGGIVP